VTRSLTRTQAVLLGAVVLLGLALGGSGLLAVGRSQRLWSPTVELTTQFAHVRGVTPGTPVRVFGHAAGEVTGLDLPDPGGTDRRVTLRLRLDARFQPLLHADASVRIHSEGLVGTPAVEIDPGTEGDLDPAVPLAAANTPSIGELTKQATTVMAKLEKVGDRAEELARDLREGKGTLGRLARDEKAYDELVGLLRAGQEAADAVRHDAEAMKKLPVVGGYVEPRAEELLVRPNYQRQRRIIAEADLFEPGRATLTESGRGKLDEVGFWLNERKAVGSEIVVVAYAPSDGLSAGNVIRKVTQTQADEVAGYLRDRHGVTKLGWWSRRKLTAAGLGTATPPLPEPAVLPPARIEVVVFLPTK
jgi:phospholipid/cholesterol/gamma-HCH transport system substrate-binding protein